MQTTDLRTNKKSADETHWAMWTGAAIGAAAVASTAAYFAWRWTRKPSMTDRLRDRAEAALEALRR